MNHAHLSPAATTVFEAVEDAGLIACGDQLHVLPRADAPPDQAPGRCLAEPLVRGRLRTEAVLLLQPLRVGEDRCAARDPLPPRRVHRRLRRLRRPLARHAGRLRLPRLLPPRLRLRVAPRRSGVRARRARPRGRERRPAHGRGGRARTSSSSATPSSSARTTARRRSIEVATLHDAFDDLSVLPGRRGDPDSADVVVTASNRSGMVYRLPSCPVGTRALAERLDDVEAGRLALPRGRLGDRPRATGRSFASGRTTRAGGSKATPTCSTRPLPERPRAGLARARVPERRRGARLGARGLRARRPRRARTTSGGGSHGSLAAGRLDRPARRRGLRRAAAARAARDRPTSRPLAFAYLGVDPARVDGLPARRPQCLSRRPPTRAGRWSTEQLRGAGSATSACSRRWAAFRARRSSTRKTGGAPTRTCRVSIGYGQTISQPYMVALIAEAAGVREGDRVLDVGTGSGYAAAVLRRARRDGAHDRADSRAGRPGAAAASQRRATGRGRARGRRLARAPGGGALHAITVAAAAPELPMALYEQLAPGGRLVVPVGDAEGQRLQVAVRSPEGPCRRPLGAVPLRAARRRGGAGGQGRTGNGGASTLGPCRRTPTPRPRARRLPAGSCPRSAGRRTGSSSPSSPRSAPPATSSTSPCSRRSSSWPT